MRSQIHFGLAALLGCALLAAFSVAEAQQSTTPSASTPSPSTTSAPASAQPDTTAQPASAQTPATPASSSDSSTTPSTNHSDRPAFGVPNDTSSTADADKSSADKSKPTGAQADTQDSKPTDTKTAAKTDALPSPGEALDPHIKKGSEDDIDAVGT